jgi:WhiB family redox-sensing transcriptional regulator
MSGIEAFNPEKYESHLRLVEPAAPETQRPKQSLASTLRLGEWAYDAACQDMDTEDFFTVFQKNSRFSQQEFQRIKQTCNGCPVSEECLEYALINHDELLGGIFGGMTHDQRSTLVRRRTNLQ